MTPYRLLRASGAPTTGETAVQSLVLRRLTDALSTSLNARFISALSKG